MAESEGFEPSIPTRSITIFETVAFDHSAISPLMNIVIYINLQHFANFFQGIVDFFILPETSYGEKSSDVAVKGK